MRALTNTADVFALYFVVCTTSTSFDFPLCRSDPLFYETLIVPMCTHQRIPIRDYKGGPPSADFAKIEEKKTMQIQCQWHSRPNNKVEIIFSIELTIKMPGFENERLNAL